MCDDCRTEVGLSESESGKRWCEKDAGHREDAMEPWFVESKALSVSCNYELVVWAAVWLNQSKQFEDKEDREEERQKLAEQGAQGGQDTQRNMLESPMRIISPTSPVVPHTYTTPWHEFLCKQMASQGETNTGETAMDVDSDVDEG